MQQYDIVFLGHYTKDTIISQAGTRYVDGGAFNYGAQMAARLGMKVGAVTRLAKEDQRVVDALEKLRISTHITYTEQSTCLILEYPTSNVDERLIHVQSTASSFTPEDVAGISAKCFLIGPSIRGEVPEEVLDALRATGTRISLDVQGFLRIPVNGTLVNDSWADKARILPKVDVLKTDAVEAHMLTGTTDIYKAAQILADYGPEEVVLTHRNGVLVLVDGQYYEAGFFPKQLVGRSGRGDTCISSYMVGRLTMPPKEATKFAAAVTSLKMEAEGPFSGTIDDVHRLLEEKYADPDLATG
jgi:sugar/nucleoside kinase (ribokinase family)